MGVKYTLSKEEHDKLRQMSCGYCGDDCDTTCVTQEKMGDGYTAQNCIPACLPCKNTKRRFDKDDFLISMANIAATHLEDVEWEYCYDYCDPCKSNKSSSFVQYVKNAKHAGREFALTEQDYDELTSSGCFYCLYDKDLVGIDRVDNSQGYTLSNVVGCCNRCNESKGKKSLEEFLEVAKNVYAHTYTTKV
jgi:hypothetical protein